MLNSPLDGRFDGMNGACDGGLRHALDRALVAARDGVLYSGLNGAFDDSKLKEKWPKF